MSDGKRRVVGVAEVQGAPGGQVLVTDIFRYERRGVHPDGRVDGAFVPTSEQPRCLERMRAFGVASAERIFARGMV